MKYRFIDHTADFGIQVTGNDPRRLFENAAFALFDLISDVARVKGQKTIPISISGDDWSDLMVNWLRELLYLCSTGNMIIKKAEISDITETTLDARIFFDPYDPDLHEIKNEIKAVTYHDLYVRQLKDLKWTAQVIFDV